MSGTTRVASGIPAVMVVAPAGTNRAFTSNPGQRLSTYKKKMESIAKIGTLANSAYPLRRNESAYQQTRPKHGGVIHLADFGNS